MENSETLQVKNPLETETIGSGIFRLPVWELFQRSAPFLILLFLAFRRAHSRLWEILSVRKIMPACKVHISVQR